MWALCNQKNWLRIFVEMAQLPGADLFGERSVVNKNIKKINWVTFLSSILSLIHTMHEQNTKWHIFRFPGSDVYNYFVSDESQTV